MKLLVFCGFKVWFALLTLFFFLEFVLTVCKRAEDSGLQICCFVFLGSTEGWTLRLVPWVYVKGC